MTALPALSGAKNTLRQRMASSQHLHPCLEKDAFQVFGPKESAPGTKTIPLFQVKMNLLAESFE